jgi:hypothetical protein
MKKALLLTTGVLLALAVQPVWAEDRLVEGFEVAAACAGDITKICAGVTPGEGRIKDCVLEKKAELSASCSAALGKALTTTLPDEAVNLKLTHFTDLRANQYTELFLIGGNPITGDISANVFNTIGLNGYTEANKNSSPTAEVAAIDVNAMKKKFDVLAFHVNGPKLWMLDWIDVPVGVERDFDRVKARFVARVDLKGIDLKDPSAGGYRKTSVERKTKFGYLKGRPAFLIDDAEGNTWIMKGMNLGLKPTESYETAKELGSRLKKLPPGWKFRVAVLPEDLVLIPTTGIAEIMPDELFNVYDRTGPGYSNFKP